MRKWMEKSFEKDQSDQMLELKGSPNVNKSCPNKRNSSSYIKWSFFKGPQKSPILMGYFGSQICNQELSKIAQSGHTGKD